MNGMGADADANRCRSAGRSWLAGLVCTFPATFHPQTEPLYTDDYHVTIHIRASNKRNLVSAQILAFSTYVPSRRDNILQRSYRSTEDGVYMQSLPNGEIVAFKSRRKEDPGVL